MVREMTKRQFHRNGFLARDADGFSLIELLVVVIIIGLLASIAIPTFLSQREKAQSAAVQSDLRNAATSATACAADKNGSYENCGVAQLGAYDFNKTDGVEIPFGAAVAEPDRWAVSARHTDNEADTVYHFDTDDGSQVRENALSP